MAKQSFLKGTTSKLARIFIQNSSLSTGAGLTGLVFNTASLSAYYIKEGGSAPVAISLATMTVGTWVSGGFKEVDATNMPGVYEIGIPDTALSSANSSLIMLKGAANMVPCLLEMQLDAINNQDGAAGGMSRVDVAISTRASQTSLDTLDDYVDTEVAAIKAKTDNIPDSPAAVGSEMILDMSQSLPTSPAFGSIGEAFVAAVAQAFGTWRLDIDAGTVTLFKPDNVTPLVVLDLDSVTEPTSRIRRIS